MKRQRRPTVGGKGEHDPDGGGKWQTEERSHPRAIPLGVASRTHRMGASAVSMKCAVEVDGLAMVQARRPIGLPRHWRRPAHQRSEATRRCGAIRRRQPPPARTPATSLQRVGRTFPTQVSACRRRGLATCCGARRAVFGGVSAAVSRRVPTRTAERSECSQRDKGHSVCVMRSSLDTAFQERVSNEV